MSPVRPARDPDQASSLFGRDRRQRPRLTLRIVGFGLIDVLGMTAFAVGAMYAFADRVAFFTGFPASLVQAWSCMLIGVALMLYAAAQILRELLKQTPPPDSES